MVADGPSGISHVPCIILGNLRPSYKDSKNFLELDSALVKPSKDGPFSNISCPMCHPGESKGGTAQLQRQRKILWNLNQPCEAFHRWFQMDPSVISHVPCVILGNLRVEQPSYKGGKNFLELDSASVKLFKDGGNVEKIKLAQRISKMKSWLK